MYPYLTKLLAKPIYDYRKEKMIAGEYYLAGDPVLVKDRRRSKTYSID
jgi:hypothetical protein